MWTRVRETLAYNVSKVDTFAKIIPSRRCFWRRDSEALGQNTDKVAEPGSVPKQFFIFEFERVENFVFSLSLYLEAINHGQWRVVVLALMNVSVDHLVLFRLWFQSVHWNLELRKIWVQWIGFEVSFGCFFAFLNRFGLRLFAHDIVSNLDVNQVLDQIQFFLELFLWVNREQTHFFHAEIMRNVCIKPRT